MADDLTISRFSDAEFERMVGAGAFDDMRVELRGGALHRMNAQHGPHLRIKTDIGAALINAVANADPPFEVSIDGSVAFGGGFIPSPDVFLWRPEPVEGFIPGRTVVLIVEVADTTLGDDLGAKLLSYARADVPEYWVVDVGGRVIHQCTDPLEEGYRVRKITPFGQTIEAKALPGVALPSVLARWAA